MVPVLAIPLLFLAVYAAHLPNINLWLRLASASVAYGIQIYSEARLGLSVSKKDNVDLERIQGKCGKDKTNVVLEGV
ncbi:UNVERIFIED_CONTAM: hypothetical protein K2H54_075006 [Gekko kuhli]